MTRIFSGTDLVHVPTLAKYLGSPDGKMLEEGWTLREQEYAKGRPDRLAAMWAAKESVMKVLGKGIGELSPLDIEIVSRLGERPEVELHGAALEFAGQMRLDDLSVSMSHEGDLATAVAVGLTKEEDR